jgi:adhesin transport system outer membrane protein
MRNYDLKKAEYQWLTLSSQILPVLGLAQPHDDSRPDEQQALTLPNDACAAAISVPDTANLTPVPFSVGAEQGAPAQAPAAAPVPAARASVMIAGVWGIFCGS